MRRIFAGQREMKGCAAAGVRGDPQAAAVRLDDRPADRESHAGALWFRGKEWVEDLLRLFWLESRAGIANRDQELTLLILLRLDGKFTSSAHVLHGIDAIEHEIHKNLLQLNPVRRDLGKI